MATMSLQAAYDQARSFLEVNKVEQAISVAQHILEYFPQNLEAHRILGEAYLAGRQFDQAEVAFSRVLHSDPENIPAHVGLGITYERQSRLDLAVNEFEQALEVRPDMPELRSQLLRLYTDVWGAEGATLRLSRPGLARLYAKGHMLPQAIQEFRSVIDEYPDRFDARVGLAEALWRDGQTDVATEVCEQILAARPDVLKANLILGYIRQAAGDSSGETYWRFAQQLEPYEHVARALFDVMPDLAPPDLEISPWDEQAWQERRSREEQERQSREEMKAPVAASAPAMSDETDFFSGWGEVAESTPSRSASPAGADDDENDDFLANLLALSAPMSSGEGVDIDSSSGITPFSFDDMSDTPQAPEPAVEPELTPFSLADLGLSEDEVAQLEATAEPEADEPELTPFSLADLGLSEDEVAQLEATAELEADEPELTPFSLADLGLSEDEVAQLEAAAEPEMLPFSLEDLGLSLDEVAQLNAAVEPGQMAQEPEPFSFDEEDVAAAAGPRTSSPSGGSPSGDMAGLAPFDWSSGDDAENAEDSQFDSDMSDLQPFSLDDLDLTSVDDYGSGRGGSLPTSLQPFSIDDGPTPPPSRDLPMPALDPDDSSETGGYSWQQPSSKPRTDFLRAEASAEPPEGSIFSKMRQRASELPKEELLPLPPVSIDDDDEAAAYFLNDNDDAPVHDEGAAGAGVLERFAGGFRLPKEGEPSGKAAPDAAAEPELTPFSLEDLGLLPEEIAALGAEEAPDAAAEPELTPFSLEDLGLSPEEIAALGAEEAPDAAAEPKLTPFSLEDLGLSPEDIAALSAGAAADAATAAEEAAKEAKANAAGATDEMAEPELTPFSLEDLGLSPEEIAALSAAEAPDADAATGDTIVPGWSDGEEPELTPFSLEDLGLSPEEIASLGQTPSAEAQSQSEVSLSDDDIDAFDFDVADEPRSAAQLSDDQAVADVEPFSFDEFDFDAGDAALAADAPAMDDAVSDVEPFSFDDLDLGDGDTSPPSYAGNRELRLTDDELAGLDLGELETFITKPSVTPQSPVMASEAENEVITGDPALDKLIYLGQRQGFIDLTDIIGVVKDPEAEAERIEEIGWTLHRAGIEIRDGDEVIDMEEGEADEEYEELVEFEASADISPAAVSDAEPDLTPFSLEELGLSPEEIAALGLSEEAPPAASPAPAPAPEAPHLEAEPELLPFSLEELGLTAEEIAMLNGSPADPPAAAEPEAAEPELTPFSLEDLGLSPEEIAALGSVQESAETGPAEAEPAEAKSAEVEPEMLPFSLEELGLSPEEIAALSQAEADLEPVAEAVDDPFSFDVVEERPVEKATRTAPRVEEPPPSPPVEDTIFTPEPLESLDDIWDVPVPAAAVSPPTPAPAPGASREKSEPPAHEKADTASRAVLPPLGDRDSARQGARRDTPSARPRDRDDGRYARREAPADRPLDDGRYARRERSSGTREDLYARREAASRVSGDRPGRRDYGRSAPAPRTMSRQSFGSFVPTGDESLDEYLMQLEVEPDIYGKAMSLARLCAQTGRPGLMAYSYKYLIRNAYALDEIVEEVLELIDTVGDEAIENQLYRVLGDAFSKQGRLRDAIAAYNHTFSG